MTTLRDFLLICDALTEDCVTSLKTAGRPQKVGGIDTPVDLFGLTYGDIIQLQEVKSLHDMFVVPCEVILKLSRNQVMKLDCEIVVPFSFWVMLKINEIGQMFKDISIQPTKEEKQAGCENLNFGPFGTLDWYALRMGITDHEEAERTKWIRIYQCMKIDNQKAIYERRLREIYAKNK